MTREEFDTLLAEIRAFCTENDIRNYTAKYSEYRGRLIKIVNDQSNETSIRVDANDIQNSLKGMFHSEYGKPLADRLKKYPESELYSGHRNLTRECMTDVAKLAMRHEYKPNPLVTEIKNYYAVN